MTRSAAVSAALAALLLATGPAAAQETPGAAGPVTVVEAVRRALAERPALGVAAAARDAAAAERARVSAEWWPRLTLDAGITRFEEPMLVAPLHGFDLQAIPDFDRTLVDATLAARWTVFEGGARSARVRAAEATLRAADAGVETTADATVALAVAAFADALAARQTLTAHDLRLEALAAERGRVTLAVREGAAAGVDRSRVDAALAGARADRVAAAAMLEVAIGDLARLTGLPEAGLAARLVAPDGVPAVAGVSDPAATPALEEVRWRARAAAAASRAARGAWWPEVATTGGWIERGAAGEENTFTSEWQVGLRLSWLVFGGGARAAAVARADAERIAAEGRLAQAELDQAAAVQRARAGLRRATARVEALAEAVAARAEVARIERLSLDVGAGVQADWLDAEADLLEARSALVRARADALVATVELARATGVLDPDWLARRLEETP